MIPADKSKLIEQLRLFKRIVDEVTEQHGPSPMLDALHAHLAGINDLTIDTEEAVLVRIHSAVVLVLVSKTVKYIGQGLAKLPLTDSELQAGKLCSEIMQRWRDVGGE